MRYIITAFLLCIVALPGQAAINESKIQDVYFTNTDDGVELHCKNCFSDFKHPNDIRFPAKLTSNWFYMPLEIVESKNYAIIQENGGSGCPGGTWYLLDKRANSMQSITEVATSTCSEVTKATLQEGQHGLTAKFHFYDTREHNQTIKLR